MKNLLVSILFINGFIIFSVLSSLAGAEGTYKLRIAYYIILNSLKGEQKGEQDGKYIRFKITRGHSLKLGERNEHYQSYHEEMKVLADERRERLKEVRVKYKMEESEGSSTEEKLPPINQAEYSAIQDKYYENENKIDNKYGVIHNERTILSQTDAIRLKDELCFKGGSIVTNESLHEKVTIAMGKINSLMNCDLSKNKLKDLNDLSLSEIKDFFEIDTDIARRALDEIDTVEFGESERELKLTDPGFLVQKAIFTDDWHKADDK